MPDKEVAFVLPEEHASSLEPHTFPGFPGLFVPGEPVGVSRLGMTATEARAAVKELDLPLHETKADVPPADFLDRTGGMLSGASGESSTAGNVVRSSSEFPGLSAEEAEARRVEAAEEEKAAVEEPAEPAGGEG